MDYKKIMVALAVEGDEIPVIQQAIHIAKRYQAKLIALHVSPPHAGEMSMMMDSIGSKIEKEDITQIFVDSGFGEEVKNIEVLITKNASIAEGIVDHSQDIDLLILGHRRMSTFKAIFMDSVDENIVNKVNCPVLVVPKK